MYMGDIYNHFTILYLYCSPVTPITSNKDIPPPAVGSRPNRFTAPTPRAGGINNRPQTVIEGI